MMCNSHKTHPWLSIVTTLYRSASFIDEFYQRMVASAEIFTKDFELILVDDGSPDESCELAIRLVERDPRVRLVELSRNFGHHHAAIAGLAHCHGEMIFYIDVDLEEQPEWLGTFIEEMQRTDADVVFGVLSQRSDKGLKRHSSTIFYSLFNAWSETPIPFNPCSVRLMRGNYVKALLSMGDKNLFLAGMQAWTGFRQHSLEVIKKPRAFGGSSYSISSMIGLAVNAITSFTSYPLRIIFYMGLLTSLLASVSGCGLLVKKIIYPDTVLLGWASLMASVWFLGGAIMCSLGIIGEYLAKVYNEVKGRPVYIVRKVHEQKHPPVQGPMHINLAMVKTDD